MNIETTSKKIYPGIGAMWIGIGLIAGLLTLYGCVSMGSLVKTEVAHQIETARSSETPSVISEADLAGLPEPVQRYLRYAGVVGKPHVRFARLKFQGFLRRAADQAWSPLNAEQSYTTDPPSLVFHARMGTSLWGRMSVREKYMDGKGYLLLKLWPGFTVADNHGGPTDIDQADRYLNEMTWFPTAYLKPYVQWEARDEQSAKVTLSHQGVTVSAIAYFNDIGEMTRFVGQKHAGTDGTLSGRERMLAGWTITLSDYEERHGFRVPTTGAGIFNLNSGDFEYIRVTGVPELEYDRFEGE